MGTTMLAGRMNFATGTFAIKEVPVPVADPGEVRIRVRAAASASGRLTSRGCLPKA
jgi:hypothetical protein